MRSKNLFLTLAATAASVAVAYPAGAILRNYGVRWATISQFNSSSPSPNNYVSGNDGTGDPPANAVVDDTGSGNPVLRKFLLFNETLQTVDVPNLSGFIYLSSITNQGPKKGLNFTGTGSTNTSIAWGTITGWTVTGGFWCHSVPSNICTYARGKDLVTGDPAFDSSFYDLGTWNFHHTGFTSIPWVHQKASPATMSVGNSAYFVRGRIRGGLVPALPVLGVALLGASLLFAGARLSRKG